MSCDISRRIAKRRASPHKRSEHAKRPGQRGNRVSAVDCKQKYDALLCVFVSRCTRGNGRVCGLVQSGSCSRQSLWSCDPHPVCLNLPLFPLIYHYHHPPHRAVRRQPHPLILTVHHSSCLLPVSSFCFDAHRTSHTRPTRTNIYAPRSFGFVFTNVYV